LRRSITSKEAVGSHPPRLHDFRLKKREHHVATAKHQRARAVEGIQKSEALAVD
jgi:hypothetical protein